jgi:hypothetical protein
LKVIYPEEKESDEYWKRRIAEAYRKRAEFAELRRVIEDDIRQMMAERNGESFDAQTVKISWGSSIRFIKPWSELGIKKIKEDMPQALIYGTNIGIMAISLQPYAVAIGASGNTVRGYIATMYFAKGKQAFAAARSAGWSGVEQGRDALGRFVPKKPGQLRPGSVAEARALDAVEKKRGWTVMRRRVRVRGNGMVREYDSLAIDPKGRVLGVDVKGGMAGRSGRQAIFDGWVNSSRANVATGTGRHVGMEVRRAVVVRPK